MNEDKSNATSEKIPTVDAFGNFAQINPEDYARYRQEYGAKIIPQSVFAEHLTKQEFEDKPWQAAGAGFGRGLTFGGSDALARLFGGKPAAHYLENLEKYNPSISLVSNIGGAVAPALLTGGESLLAEGALEGAVLEKAASGGLKTLLAPAEKQAVLKAANYAPSSLAGRLGHNVTHALADSESIKSLARGGAFAKVASKVIPRAAGFAAEAAPYGAAHAISENMLGDADLNASKIMTDIGINSALTGVFGGGLGSVVGLGEAFLPKFLKKGTSLAQDLSDKINESYQDHVSKSLARLDLPQEEMGLAQDLATSKESRELAKMSDLGMANRQGAVLRDVQALDKISNEGSKEFNKTVRGAFNRYHLSDLPIERAMPEVQKTYGLANEILTDLQSNPQLAGQPIVRQVEKLLRTYADPLFGAEKISDAGAFYEKFRDFQQDLGKILYQDNKIAYGDNVGKYLRDELSPIYKSAKSALENEGIFGDAASYQSKLTSINNRYFKGRSGDLFKEFFGKISKDSDGNITGVRVLPSKIKKLSNQFFEEYGAQAKEALDNYVNSVQEKFQLQNEISKRLPTGRFGYDKALEDINQTYGRIQNGLTDISKRKALKILKTISVPETGYTSGNLLKGALKRLPFVGRYAEYIPTSTTPAGMIDRLHTMDRVLNQVDSKIDNLFERFLSGKDASDLEKTLKKAIVPISAESTETIFGHGAIHGFLDSLDKHGPELENKLAELNALNLDQDRMQEVLAKNLETMYHFAPNAASAYAAKAMKAFQYLQAKAPKDQRSDIEKLISHSKVFYSDQDKHKFKNVLLSLENPMLPLIHMVNGKMTSEDKEIMRLIHPELLEHQSKKMINAISDGNHKLTYAQRMNVGNYFDIPVDYSLTPEFKAGYQKVIQASNQEQQQPQGPRQPKVKTSKLQNVSQSMTATQSIQANNARQP